MKKIIFLTLGIVLITANYVIAAEMAVESKITKITVYPGAALISREAQLKLNPGEYKIIFPDIIPDIDEDSLRVSAEGNAAAKLYGAELKREYLEEVPSEKIKQLKDEVQKLQDQIRETEGLKGLFFEEKDFLNSIRLFSKDQLPKDLATKMPQPAELEGILKFLDAKLKENRSLVMDCEVKARDLKNKLSVLERELSQISGPTKKMKRSIIVDAVVIKPGNLNLTVSYLVRGVNWMPLYDARADFEKSAVELISYGIVRQNTGEDWVDVEMVLSTAKPAIGGNMPYVGPWILRPYQPVRHMDREVQMAAKSLMVQTEAFAPEEEKEAGYAEPKIEYAVPEEKGIAVVYKLPRKTSIKADGSEHKLPISAQTLNASFEYSSFPRATVSAYLGSRVTNAPDLQLLSGRVNIFLQGDFVGISSIGNIAPQEEFDLYLGADENVKVKRELVEKKVDETLIGNIASPNKRTVFKYKLSVENYKARKITVKLFEAMPVSEDDRIKIKMEKVSVEPREKDWKQRRGIWLWEISLEPKAKQEIFYSFIIDHPRDMQVEGL